ncbi:hypothetical protein [Pontibacter sp. G13]|uniref:hypothetical protein n=1 Tax=Pontibacter sp. G13 TaxID=3074898 RepID=UPI00288B706E|nr:hypothetical protein [Pontibacter sp. G13]WNJ20892.1 hypothetical protein RJD25_10470 [Pontibacter sp. G13]
MKPFADIPTPELDMLIQEKDFEMLDLQERAWVLSEMSEMEYRQVRDFYLAAQAYLTPPALTPRTETRDLLMERFREEHRPSVIRQLGKLAQYKVPLYQIAAAAVVLILSANFITQNPLTPAMHIDGHEYFVDSTNSDTFIHPTSLTDDTLKGWYK